MPTMVASFLVRFWIEPRVDVAFEWRGWIQHVQSGESVYFADAEKLLRFVAAHSLVRFEEGARERQGEGERG